MRELQELNDETLKNHREGGDEDASFIGPSFSYDIYITRESDSTSTSISNSLITTNMEHLFKKPTRQSIVDENEKFDFVEKVFKFCNIFLVFIFHV